MTDNPTQAAPFKGPFRCAGVLSGFGPNVVLDGTGKFYIGCIDEYNAGQLCDRLNAAAPSEGVRAGDIERQETQWAEMKPDLYDGDTCDKLRPRWECQADGDHGGSDYEGTVRLAARCFPPGTRVSIQEPLCPKCSELREPVFPIPTRAPLYKGSCRCGFDWDAWVEEQYS